MGLLFKSTSRLNYTSCGYGHQRQLYKSFTDTGGSKALHKSYMTPKLIYLNVLLDIFHRSFQAPRGFPYRQPKSGQVTYLTVCSKAHQR